MPASPNESSLVRLLLADHAGDQPRDGLEHHERRKLSPGEHVVADRELLGRQSLDDPFVDALVPPADQHEPRLLRELASERLVQAAPGG